MSADILIIGGGISGLSAAHFLRKKNISVHVVESSPRAGGSIRTEIAGGYMFECGPNSAALSNTALVELIADCSLDSQMLFPGANGKKRFILKQGRLRPLPMSPISFLFGGFFSLKTKLNVIAEPFLPAGVGDDETIADFFTRRFGEQVTEDVIRPFISGIYAGDAGATSMRAAFTTVFEAERKYGSVIGGMVRTMFAGQKKEKRSKAATGKMFTFRGGLQALSDSLAARLADSITYNAQALGIEENPLGVRVSWLSNGETRQDTYKKIIIASSAHAAAALIGNISESLAAMLNGIHYAPIGIVHTAYSRESVAHPLDGFGFLVPPREKRNVLGCIFSTSLFPNRAPQSIVLFTTFIGGAMQSASLSRTTEQILESTANELKSILNIRGKPLLSKYTAIPHAIPQYALGHQAILDSAEKFEKEHPAILLCGNYLGGVSIANCIGNAKKKTDGVSV